MKYAYEGSTGGYPLEEDTQEEPEIICALCDEVCTDNFHVVMETIVCQWCYSHNENLHQSIKHLHNGNL